MTWRAGTVGLFLLAAIAAGAEEPAAPLANSAKELKTLQRDPTGKDRGKLSEVLPQVSTPTPGATPLETPPLPKTDAELKKRKEAQKNWLVEGVDRLGKNTATKGRSDGPRETGAAGEEEEKLDSSDPDYILKLYTEQQKEAEAKAGAKQTAPTRPDPFAPFLQGWLGHSPERGKFFDESIKRSDTGPGVATPGGPPVAGGSQIFSSGETAGNPRGTAAEAKPNPYLSGLDLSPALPDPGGSHPATALDLGGMMKSPDRPTSAPPSNPLPASRPAEKKPLPPALSEDNKYFPQLKRF